MGSLIVWSSVPEIWGHKYCQQSNKKELKGGNSYRLEVLRNEDNRVTNFAEILKPENFSWKCKEFTETFEDKWE